MLRVRFGRGELVQVGLGQLVSQLLAVGRHPVEDAGGGAHRVGDVELAAGEGGAHGQQLVARHERPLLLGRGQLPRQRLQPNATIVVVMTRWGELDLTGQLRRQEIEDQDGETWELVL